MTVCVVSVVPRISVSVGIVFMVSVTVGEKGWVVSDVEGRRPFYVDHFPDGYFKTRTWGYVRPSDVKEYSLREG